MSREGNDQRIAPFAVDGCRFDSINASNLTVHVYSDRLSTYR